MTQEEYEGILFERALREAEGLENAFWGAQ
jgi:hypothetical protein